MGLHSYVHFRCVWGACELIFPEPQARRDCQKEHANTYILPKHGVAQQVVSRPVTPCGPIPKSLSILTVSNSRTPSEFVTLYLPHAPRLIGAGTAHPGLPLIQRCHPDARQCSRRNSKRIVFKSSPTAQRDRKARSHRTCCGRRHGEWEGCPKPRGRGCSRSKAEERPKESREAAVCGRDYMGKWSRRRSPATCHTG